MVYVYGNSFCTLPSGKSAKDVVADYLRGLYEHLVKRLRHHDDTFFGITPMEFWITVPAMWTDAAKTATIEAAQALALDPARWIPCISLLSLRLRHCQY